MQRTLDSKLSYKALRRGHKNRFVAAGSKFNIKRFCLINKRYYRVSNICLMRRLNTYKSLSERFWDYIPKWIQNRQRRYFNHNNVNHSDLNHLKICHFLNDLNKDRTTEEIKSLEENLRHYQILEENTIMIENQEMVEVYAVQITKTKSYTSPDGEYSGVIELDEKLNIGKVGIKFLIEKNIYSKMKREFIINKINENSDLILYWDVNNSKIRNENKKFTHIEEIIKNVKD